MNFKELVNEALGENDVVLYHVGPDKYNRDFKECFFRFKDNDKSFKFYYIDNAVNCFIMPKTDEDYVQAHMGANSIFTVYRILHKIVHDHLKEEEIIKAGATKEQAQTIIKI